jgi:hypothetical protein
MARVFEDQIPALRTGLQECNLADKLGLTAAMIAAGDTNDLFVIQIKTIPVFGDQRYLRDVVICGAVRMSKNLGALTDGNVAGNTNIADVRLDFTTLDPNLPADQVTAYGQRNWDSN